MFSNVTRDISAVIILLGYPSAKVLTTEFSWNKSQSNVCKPNESNYQWEMPTILFLTIRIFSRERPRQIFSNFCIDAMSEGYQALRHTKIGRAHV